MTAFWLSFTMTGILAAFYIGYKVKRGGISSTFAKTAASLGFVATGICALVQNARPASAVLCFALVLGMTGDILIDLYNDEEEKTGPFLIAGFLLFAFEHIAVIVSVTMATGFSPLSFFLSLASGIVFSYLVIAVMKKKLAFHFGDFLIPAYGYSVILAFCLTYYLFAAFANARFYLLAGGMGMFLISDVVLAFILFGGKKENIYPVINLITYYAGQMLFAASLLYAY